MRKSGANETCNSLKGMMYKKQKKTVNVNIFFGVHPNQSLKPTRNRERDFLGNSSEDSSK